jgi:hypothetical protein
MLVPTEDQQTSGELKVSDIARIRPNRRPKQSFIDGEQVWRLTPRLQLTITPVALSASWQLRERIVVIDRPSFPFCALFRGPAMFYLSRFTEVQLNGG